EPTKIPSTPPAIAFAADVAKVGSACGSDLTQAIGASPACFRPCSARPSMNNEPGSFVPIREILVAPESSRPATAPYAHPGIPLAVGNTPGALSSVGER